MKDLSLKSTECVILFGFLIFFIASFPSVQAVSTVNITIPNGASSGPGYSPDVFVVVIGVNNTIQWTNDDSVVHTVTASDQKSFNSRDLQAGQSYSVTLTAPGVFNYTCIYHPKMKGTVIVEASTSVATTPEFPAAMLAPILLAVLFAAAVLLSRLKPTAPSTR